MSSEVEKPVTITSFDFENVKRIKAVALTPAAAGLTVIGGRNAQGKTSVLDAICWALGGKDYEPTGSHRDGSMRDPELHVELSNGIVVERKGKSSALKVTDTTGKRAGQTLLNSFVEKFALDLPRFLQESDKDKALTLLRIIGIENELKELDQREATLSQQRLTTGQIARQKRGAAEELPFHPEAPADFVDIADLAEQQREALAHNAENQRWRDALTAQEQRVILISNELEAARTEVIRREADLDLANDHLDKIRATVQALQDVDTQPIANAIDDAQRLNALVSENRASVSALSEADEYEARYKELDAQVNAVRNERMQLLNNIDMPLPDLTIQDSTLVYRGHVWSDMSSAEQLEVATAIVRRLNPACGFVLVDKLEQLDTQTLQEFGQWCEAQGLQVIGTRVSTGSECSVLIEDGMVAASNLKPATESATQYTDDQILQPEPWPVKFAQPGIQPAGAVMPEMQPVSQPVFKPAF